MKIQRISAFLLLAVLPFEKLQAQNTTSAQDLEVAKQYQKTYEKSAAIVLSAETTYEFRLDSKKATPYLTEDEHNELMSLRVNNKVAKFKYYDDQSEIILAKSTNTRFKSTYLKTTCGNYEMDNIFYSDAKTCRYDMDFSSVGEKQHFYLQKSYKDLKYFTSVYFNDVFPVRVRKITFIIPDWLQVELKEMNFEGHKIQKKQTADAKKKATVYEYTIENLPPFENEKFERGRSYTYPHLLVLSKGYTSNGKQTSILASVNDLYAWYSSLTNSVTNDTQPLKATVEKLMAGKTTDVEKIKAIYYWVQDNIRYIAFEDGIAGFKPEAAQAVFQNKYGDCKGMANLTKTMLTIAGYDARLTWIGTNKIAYNYSIPSLAVDNHMICTVVHRDKKYFLDATEKFISFQDNAERIQGRQVMIENGDQFILDHVPVATKDRNLFKTEQTLQLEGNTLTGKGISVFNGEMKTGVLNMIYEAPTDKKLIALEKTIKQDDKNITLNKLQHSSLIDREIPLKVNYELVANNLVSSFENDLYVDVDFDKVFVNFTIKPERVSDLAFNEKIFRTLLVNLKTPKGYKVSYLPKNVEVKHNAFSIKLTYHEKNGEIRYEKAINIDHGIIQRQDFEAWNEAIRQLKKAYADKIVLTKI